MIMDDSDLVRGPGPAGQPLGFEAAIQSGISDHSESTQNSAGIVVFAVVVA
eukprot:CAMPEP_0194762712 /NCGR_PEP_ID=MMETSP0323_2-20130528/16712_1 /TAXON_ID=2866 ORGANISM="Crypthecodinium cohnii, Strain Seligo" /NCGR_SAMPLE_ID=MMETSP0323_2 /ASSEMBLY_ACC=CAM_ASM_000346 /LENGTH=50 /DNA_ID=CAMNT_0039685701 /DNA_START=195 /DNA_END=343 /DNA_ORIENTATION=-